MKCAGSTRLTRSNTRNNTSTDTGVSSGTMSDCELSEGVKEYLNKLLQSYTADQRKATAELTSLLSAQIDELKSIVNEKNQLIEQLSEKVVSVVQRNVELSGELQHLRESTHVGVDDLEQYGRKNNLRIEGIVVGDEETPAQLTAKVAETLNAMGAEVTPDDFFRLHRSGKTRMVDGRRVAQTIVRFRSWAARTRAFTTRYAKTGETREVVRARPHFVRLDLTKRRLLLLDNAQSKLRNHDHAHAYADSECNLLVVIRDTNEKYRFNTTRELNHALSCVERYTMDVA